MMGRVGKVNRGGEAMETPGGRLVSVCLVPATQAKPLSRVGKRHKRHVAAKSRSRNRKG